MSMSDCDHCWNTPCTCGWDYRNWSLEDLKKQIKMLAEVIAFKNMHKEMDDKKFLDYLACK